MEEKIFFVLFGFGILILFVVINMFRSVEKRELEKLEKEPRGETENQETPPPPWQVFLECVNEDAWDPVNIRRRMKEEEEREINWGIDGCGYSIECSNDD